MQLATLPKFTRVFLSIFLAIASLFCELFGLPTLPHGKLVDMNKFQLVWADEFDGDSLDTTKWGPHCGWDRDSSGTYIRKGSYWNQGMCSVSDGALHISTAYYPDGFNGNGKAGWYTAGIDTAGKFSQCGGYYECRCILPKGVGLWSAFWIYSGDVGNIGNGGVDGAEIDIFESAKYHLGKNQRNSVSSAVHYDGYGEYHKSKTVQWSKILDNNPYEEYNTYALEWNEKEYIFYINGIKVGKSDFGGTSQMEEDIILSVEVGGNNGVPTESWAGDSIDTNTEAPTDFIVDYVRVYQYK
ncbi:MAG: glycoside hydrolase family 16 protein [Clostridia bacterium]|nr:glycoside hydrolase family 16 protein [Clostridia bacterium]